MLFRIWNFGKTFSWHRHSICHVVLSTNPPFGSIGPAKCAVFCSLCRAYTVVYTSYSVLCTESSELCIVKSYHFSVYSLQCSSNSLQCSLYNILLASAQHLPCCTKHQPTIWEYLSRLLHVTLYMFRSLDWFSHLTTTTVPHPCKLWGHCTVHCVALLSSLLDCMLVHWHCAVCHWNVPYGAALCYMLLSCDALYHTVLYDYDTSPKWVVCWSVCIFKCHAGYVISRFVIANMSKTLSPLSILFYIWHFWRVQYDTFKFQQAKMSIHGSNTE